MKKELLKFINKHYGEFEFTVLEYSQNGKDHFVTLDFGDDEIIKLIIRERKGDNGNFRITLES